VLRKNRSITRAEEMIKLSPLVLVRGATLDVK